MTLSSHGFLQFEYGAIMNGFEFWRVITGHLIHWSPGQALWDIGAFASSGFILCLISPRDFLKLLIVVPILCSILMLIEGSPVNYRGLSGIDVAFCSYVSLRIAVDGFSERRKSFFLGAVSFFLMWIKIIFELTQGTTVFVRTDEFVPVISVHFYGALCGSFLAFYPPLRRFSCKITAVFR